MLEILAIREFTNKTKYDRIPMVMGMLFDKDIETSDERVKSAIQEYEYKSKFGFLNELQSAVRTDEEYAKYKGYID